MDIKNREIKSAIRINHSNYNDIFDEKEFFDAEEALKEVQNGRYEIIYYLNSSKIGDIYNRLNEGNNFKFYPLQGLEYDALIVIDDKYTLIKLEC